LSGIPSRLAARRSAASTSTRIHGSGGRPTLTASSKIALGNAYQNAEVSGNSATSISRRMLAEKPKGDALIAVSIG
jgi:hypothetical protein